MTVQPKRKQRIFHFDDDLGTWATYEKISPDYKLLDSCIKWSNKPK